jgi:hypothetical protein
MFKVYKAYKEKAFSPEVRLANRLAFPASPNAMD